MWVVVRISRFKQLAIRAQEARDDIARHFVARDKDRLGVFGHRDQPTVEHPVQRARQGEAVAGGIAAVAVHGADVGGLNFRPAPAVTQLQAGHGAAIVIGLAHLSGKGDLAIFAPRQAFDHRALEIFL